ncbi:MAG TPA: hypothetical protein VNX68_02280, partial [Nitrosopumilaceae archaeon]|nr:hypothetical protein [Nitrosopumilaceae archaeon]
LEAMAYFLLQFCTFADHDYYTIDLYILPVLIVIAIFELLKTHYGKILSSPFSRISFFIFFIFNVYYANSKVKDRYEGWRNDYPKFKEIYTITPYLRQIGITPSDAIISIPDGSNATLYLMNQKGWTEYADHNLDKGNPIRYNEDSSGIQSSVNKGARYLVLNGIGELYKKPYLKSFCTSLIGNYNGVLIFLLKDRKNNFNPDVRKEMERLFCNADTLTKDKQFFVANGALFEGSASQSDEFAYSGRYSVKLNANSPYGMGKRFNHLTIGESIVVTVWRKKNKESKGSLVASSGSYYNSEFEIVETNPDGWEKMRKEFFITDELTKQELVIFLFNPDNDPVYFDDLEIKRYAPVEIPAMP